MPEKTPATFVTVWDVRRGTTPRQIKRAKFVWLVTVRDPDSGTLAFGLVHQIGGTIGMPPIGGCAITPRPPEILPIAAETRRLSLN